MTNPTNVQRSRRSGSGEVPLQTRANTIVKSADHGTRLARAAAASRIPLDTGSCSASSSTTLAKSAIRLTLRTSHCSST